jgi:tetratricopeptide (TPR) repeat protein
LQEHEKPSSAAVPALVGRRSEIVALSRMLSQAEAGSGSTAIVSGPGGIGKTSILRWVEEASNDHKLWVRWGYCLPGVQEPFFPLEQVFRPDRRGTPSQPGATGDAGPRGLPQTFFPQARIKASPTELPLAFLPLTRAPKTGRSSPESRAPANVLMDYLTTLESEAASRPCVLLLDDFHWADPDSVQALRFLGRNIKRLPVLMVVGLREDEVKGFAFQEVLRDLKREGLASDISLGGLDEKAALQLLEGTIHAPLDPTTATEAVRYLLGQTGGNPYFFLEVVRQLQGSGMIRVEGGKTIMVHPSGKGAGKVRFAVPDAISTLLKQRLDTLARDDRDLLDAAAILGQEFEMAPLDAIFHSRDENVGTALRRLSTKGGLIVPRDGEGTRYAFAHALLWETVTDTTPEEKMRPWAEQLATWLEAHRPADIERIAELHESGGSTAKALACVDRIIALSLQMHAHERVAGYFERGLALMEQAKTSPAQMAEWGLSVVGRLRSDGTSIRLLDPMCRRLLKLDPPAPLSWEVLLRLANALASTNVGEGKQLLSKVREETRKRPEIVSQALLGRVAVANAVLLYAEGKPDDSAEAAREALSTLPEEERFFRGLAYEQLGWIDMDRNQWGEATANLEKGLIVAREGRSYGLMPAFLNLKGSMASLEGNLTLAESCFNEGLSICRNLGEIAGLSLYGSNLSQTRRDMGNIEGAEDVAREALRIAEAFDLHFPRGVAAMGLGEVLIQKKSFAEAEELFRRAGVVFEKIGAGEMVLQLGIDTAEMRGMMGDTEGALSALTEMKNAKDLKQDQAARLHLLRASFMNDSSAKEEVRTAIELALDESKKKDMRYWEGRALIALSAWEKKWGSPDKAAGVREQAEKILRECGVTNLSLFTGEAT